MPSLCNYRAGPGLFKLNSKFVAFIASADVISVSKTEQTSIESVTRLRISYDFFPRAKLVSSLWELQNIYFFVASSKKRPLLFGGLFFGWWVSGHPASDMNQEAKRRGARMKACSLNWGDWRIVLLRSFKILLSILGSVCIVGSEIPAPVENEILPQVLHLVGRIFGSTISPGFYRKPTIVSCKLVYGVSLVTSSPARIPSQVG